VTRLLLQKAYFIAICYVKELVPVVVGHYNKIQNTTFGKIMCVEA